MKRMQAKKKHKIRTYDTIDIISLSCFDDKRSVFYDGINTLAYFHKDYKKCDKSENNNHNNNDNHNNDQWQ